MGELPYLKFIEDFIDDPSAALALWGITGILEQYHAYLAGAGLLRDEPKTDTQ